MSDLLDRMQETDHRAEIIAAPSFAEWTATSEIGRVYSNYSWIEQAFDSVRSVPNTYLPSLLYLPGRSIDELLGEVFVISKRHSDNSRDRDDSAYLRDERKPHPEADASGEYAFFRCRPHADCDEAWKRGYGSMGYGRNFEVIRRDGSDLLVMSADQILSTYWLTIEETTEENRRSA